MRMLKKLLVLVLSTFLLSSCDDIEALLTLVPRFNGELPDVISGRWCYFETESDRVNAEYTYKYEFDPLEMSVTYSHHDNAKIIEQGIYSYRYEKFDITKVSGYITIELDNSPSVTYGFLYQATATDGPEALTLVKDNASLEFVYWGEL